MNHPDVQRLLDIEAIKQLKSRYCRYIDTKQWDALHTLFADGVRFDGFASAPTGSDGAAFVKGVSTRLKDAITMHHCHTPDIVFLDDSTARCVWAMADYMEWGRTPSAFRILPTRAACTASATTRRSTAG